jgi:hypothetical protein
VIKNYSFSGGLIETKPAGERQPDYGGGFSAHERNAKKGCSYSNGVPCLECPWDYCIAYEKSFGVARER